MLMKKTQSIIVTAVPRRTKHSRKKKKVRPIHHIDDSFQLPSTPSKLYVPSTSIRSKALERRSINDNAESFKKKTQRNLRGGTKAKTTPSVKFCIVMSTIIGIFCILIGLGIGIYFWTRTNTRLLSHGNAVIRWNTVGLTVAGTSGVLGNNTRQFNQPLDVAVSSFSTLYVIDYANNRLQKWFIGASNGQTIAGYPNNTNTQLKGPINLSLDDDENIYIADSGNHRIQFFSKGSSVGSTVAGNGTIGSANHLLWNPCGLSFDSGSKTLYIADTNNRRIMRYINGAGNIGSQVAGGNASGPIRTFFIQPHRVHFDAITNSLLIVDLGINSVVRWMLGANSWSLVVGSINGTSGNSSELLNAPMSVTLDPMGNLYVADSFNHRIQFFESGQTKGRTIAGVTGISGANATHLNYPYSVALDNQLNIYVADTMNQRVQKFQRY